MPRTISLPIPRDIARVVVLVLSLLMLTSCFTYTTIRNADDVYANDKSNIVFLGYDIAVNHYRVEAIAIEYVDEKNRTRQLNIGDFKDKERYKGARAFRLPFGRYTLKDVLYSVDTGQKTTKKCEMKDGEEKCRTTVENLSKTFRINTDFNLSFAVGPTSAPYIGRLKVPFYGVQDEDVVIPSTHTLQLDQDLALIKDDALRSALQAHLSASL